MLNDSHPAHIAERRGRAAWDTVPRHAEGTPSRTEPCRGTVDRVPTVVYLVR